MPKGGNNGSGSPNLDEPLDHWMKKRKPVKKMYITDKSKHTDVGK